MVVYPNSTAISAGPAAAEFCLSGRAGYWRKDTIQRPLDRRLPLSAGAAN
jgi:hypothetical protein